MEKTVCIIGAGIGGLTAGACLVMRGYKVTVLEKATTVGGSAGWYERKGRIFPTGATIAFGLEEHGLLSSLLQDLQIDVDVEALDHPMDVILPDRTVSIYKEHESWNNELKKAFPEKSEAVQMFWDELTRISEMVHQLTATKVAMPIRRIADLGKLPSFAVTHPLLMLQLGRYATWTVEDLLKKYNLASYEPLCHFINAQLIDAVQIDLTRAALLPSSLALAIYRKGSFHIKKGMGELSKALAKRIEELGGEVILSSPVKEVYFDKTMKKWQVNSKKKSASYQMVINNSGKSFGQGTSYTDQNQFSWGAFRVDALVQGDLWENELDGRALPFAYQIKPERENAEVFGDANGPVYVTFHPSQDRNGQQVEGELTMTCSIHTHLSDWFSSSKEEYLIKKDKFIAAIFSEIEKVIPVKQYLISSEAGTPLTYQKFVGKGAVGGFPLTVKNAILKPNSARTSLPNWYIVGEQAFPGPGTLSSALSGFYAARAIIEG